MVGADFSHHYGEEIEIDNATGQRLIETGQAEEVKPEKTTIKSKRLIK